MWGGPAVVHFFKHYESKLFTRILNKRHREKPIRINNLQNIFWMILMSPHWLRMWVCILTFMAHIGTWTYIHTCMYMHLFMYIYIYANKFVRLFFKSLLNQLKWTNMYCTFTMFWGSELELDYCSYSFQLVSCLHSCDG